MLPSARGHAVIALFTAVPHNHLIFELCLHCSASAILVFRERSALMPGYSTGIPNYGCGTCPSNQQGPCCKHISSDAGCRARRCRHSCCKLRRQAVSMMWHFHTSTARCLQHVGWERSVCGTLAAAGSCCACLCPTWTAAASPSCRFATCHTYLARADHLLIISHGRFLCDSRAAYAAQKSCQWCCFGHAHIWPAFCAWAKISTMCISGMQ